MTAPTPDESHDSTAAIDAVATIVGAGRFLRLELIAGAAAMEFVLDPEPATGCLRDLSSTVARWLGVDRDVVLTVVVAAVGQPVANSQRAAA